MGGEAMNPLLIRRRGMMQAQGGLPYDAEIAYLESTYGQYIELPIYGQKGLNYEVRVDFPTGTGHSNYPVVLGAQTSDTSRRYTLMISITSNKAYFNLNNVEKYFAITAATHIYKFENQKAYIDGTLKWTFSASDFVTPFPIILFNFSDNGVVNINRSVGTRLYYCRFYGTANLDLIPVRVGTTGYMYDRVSGQLFGNSGTGDFILGPDVQ